MSELRHLSWHGVKHRLGTLYNIYWIKLINKTPHRRIRDPSHLGFSLLFPVSFSSICHYKPSAGGHTEHKRASKHAFPIPTSTPWLMLFPLPKPPLPTSTKLLSFFESQLIGYCFHDVHLDCLVKNDSSLLGTLSAPICISLWQQHCIAVFCYYAKTQLGDQNFLESYQ